MITTSAAHLPPFLEPEQAQEKIQKKEASAQGVPNVSPFLGSRPSSTSQSGFGAGPSNPGSDPQVPDMSNQDGQSFTGSKEQVPSPSVVQVCILLVQQLSARQFCRLKNLSYFSGARVKHSSRASGRIHCIQLRISISKNLSGPVMKVRVRGRSAFQREPAAVSLAL